MTMKPVFLSAAGALALAGCTVGPNYARPEPPRASAGAFTGAQNPAFTQAELQAGWWRLYQDPMLDQLVEEAFQHNTDLRVAIANVARVRAVLRETRAGRLPDVGVSAGASYARVPETQVPPGADRESASFDAGLNVSYEVDLFGRVTRSIEAGRADLAAEEAARDSVRVMVAAETARAYGDAAAAAARLEVAERSLALIERTRALQIRITEAGRGTGLDVARVTSLAEQQRASLSPLRAERDAALFRLAALTGRAPAALSPAAGARRTILRLDQPIPVGDGMQLLARRPDIREAERRLAASTARIGVATADLYPRVTLGGQAGATGPSLGNLFTGGPIRWLLSSLISWSFTDQETVRARIRAAEATSEADLARFDGAILTALRETETALSAYRNEIERRAALLGARDAAARAAELERLRLRAGRSDSLAVLDAERTLAAAEAALADSDARLVSDQIDLFRALGGGWQVESSSG